MAQVGMTMPELIFKDSALFLFQEEYDLERYII